MSLVVASRTEHGIYIVSETKITSDSERRNPLLKGLAKIFLLNDDRCIAFVGYVERAIEAVKNLSPQDDTQHIINALKSASATGEVSFLVACLKPNRQIFFIRNNSALVAPDGWIGDHAAYSRYRDFLEGRRNSSQIYDVSLWALKMPDHVPDYDHKLYGSMYDSMATAIYSGEIESIGGFVVPVISDQNQFRFGCYSAAFRRPIDPILEQIGPEWKTLQLEDASAGGYAVGFDHIGKGFVVYIKQGKIAILFEPKDSPILEPTVTQNVDEVNYVKALESRFGPWQGFSLIAPPGVFWEKAHALGVQNLFSEAIDLFSEGIRRSSQSWERASGSQVQYDSLRDYINNSGSATKIPPGIAKYLKKAFYTRGLCHYQIKQYRDALQDCNDALLIDPNFSDSLVFKEHLLEILRGLPEQA